MFGEIGIHIQKLAALSERCYPQRNLAVRGASDPLNQRPASVSRKIELGRGCSRRNSDVQEGVRGFKRVLVGVEAVHPYRVFETLLELHIFSRDQGHGFELCVKFLSR